MCSQRRTTSDTCPTMCTRPRSNTNKSLKPYRYLLDTLCIQYCGGLKSMVRTLLYIEHNQTILFATASFPFARAWKKPGSTLAAVSSTYPRISPAIFDLDSGRPFFGKFGRMSCCLRSLKSSSRGLKYLPFGGKNLIDTPRSSNRSLATGL